MSIDATDLFGPYLLNKEGIDYNVIVTGAEVGVFALGYTGKDGLFHTENIGRAGRNLAKKLYEYEGIYKEFKFKFYLNEQAAFHHECRLFHELKPRDTFLHPLRPAGSTIKCSVCGM